MGRIRCSNCGRKVDDGFDYCPSCGSRLVHEMKPEGGGGMRTALIVLLCLVVIGGASVGTVWLVREKDREEAGRELLRQRRDSMKAAEIARLRSIREHEDSMRAVADAEAERRQLESQMFTLDDFLSSVSGGVSLRRPDDVVRTLRERGYSTIRREAGGRCTVMGLNAEIREGKIAGRGQTFSAAGIWNSRVEVVFSSAALADEFVGGAKRWGFGATADATVMRNTENRRLTLTRRGECSVELAVEL